MKTKIVNLITLLVVGGACFAIDYLSKNMLLGIFADSENPIFEITSFFNIVLTYNHGISFGMLNNDVYEQWMFMVLTSAIVFALVIWLFTTKRKSMMIAISAVIGGALGNIYDRYTYGGVIDFIDFHIGLWHYPAFNMADSFIVLGVIALLFISNPKESED